MRIALLVALMGAPTLALAQDDILTECPATVPTIVDSLVKAEKAFGQKDMAGFAEHRDTARRKLECLTEILSPRVAALYHRVQGYGFYAAQEGADALAAFRAARKVDPAYRMSAGFGPDAGLYELWKKAGESSMSGAATTAISGPGDALVYVDGRRALARSPELPALLQLVSLHGGVKQSRYVRRGAEGPSWASAAKPEEESEAEGGVATATGTDAPITKAEAGVATAGGSVADATRERGKVELAKKGPRFRKSTAPMMLAGVTTLGVTAALAGTAFQRESEFNEPWQTYEGRVDLQRRANNLGYAAQITGLAGVGLLVGAGFTIDW